MKLNCALCSICSEIVKEKASSFVIFDIYECSQNLKAEISALKTPYELTAFCVLTANTTTFNYCTDKVCLTKKSYENNI